MQVTVIGVDLAKNVFQVHGAAPERTAVLRKKLSRSQFRILWPGSQAALLPWRPVQQPLLGPRDDQDGT